jgi:epoxyqueuosine reductase
MDARARTLELAREAGFDLAGIAPLRPPARAAEFGRWLAAGRHGAMGWLAADADRIRDPRVLLPEGRSVLVVALGHSRPAVETADGARVARYAAGRDYHNVVGKRLRRLASRLRREGVLREWKKVVDAGPLLERSHAQEAGLGFESKAANLLHPRFGPWFFLGELLLDADLEPTATPVAGSCGTCTACLDACPTGAIVGPGEVDARRCISYLTIEHPGAIAPELRPALGDWVFGCDVCSEVCPWGAKAPDLSERFGTHAGVEGAELADWVRSGRPTLGLAGSALQRPGDEGLVRNALLHLGNRPREGGASVLLEALTAQASGALREAAGWALGKGYAPDAGVRAGLEAAARRDPDPGVREALARWRAEIG